MFQHILLPTDGSATSEAAIRAGLHFAREINARVTGLHVVQPYHVLTYHPDMLEDTAAQYEKDSSAHAAKLLAALARQAQEVGVPCETLVAGSDDIYKAIIDTASERQCDLIAMASHGRKGLRGLLMGSETQKVLTHSHVPVLVFR
jgi:nucleotide-binding universal stress UspA family protein